MGKSQETFRKKEVKNRKEKKRKDKAKKKLARKDAPKSDENGMIAYVDEFGRISSTPPDPMKKLHVNPDTIEIKISRRTEEEPKNTERTGILTFYNDSKGFGYIKDSETGESVFVHVSEFTEDISLHAKVHFTIGMGNRGPQARQVKLAGKKT
jgi:cold shock CspA family protein